MSARPPLLVRLARIGTLPGERYVHPTLGALTASALLMLRPSAPPSSVLLPLAGASLGAIIAHHAVKLVYHRPRPAIALARHKLEAAYPSGHTTDATAVVVTSAVLLGQQRVLPLGFAAPLAVALCIVTGVSRVVLGWHWVTDVIGGWLVGLAVAAECVALYGRLA